MSQLSDPIADFLTRLRNAGGAKKAELTAPYSKMKAEIAWANSSARSRIRAWTRSSSKALLSTELTDQVAKARRLLDWAPSFELDAGLERTVSWYREFLAHAA